MPEVTASICPNGAKPDPIPILQYALEVERTGKDHIRHLGGIPPRSFGGSNNRLADVGQFIRTEYGVLI